MIHLIKIKSKLISPLKDLLAEPVKKSDLASIEKAKTLFKSCMDEGNLLDICFSIYDKKTFIIAT